ncbi:MAG: T9SS type A sorting domain-containing protein, partial [Bacteroidia bacterium]
TYIWNPGNFAGNNLPTTLASSTIFTVSGTTNGCTNTATVSVSVSLCTGITKNGNSTTFKVYPNPTQGFVTLSFEEDFTGQVNIFNTLGQLLITQKLNGSEKIEMNLTSYPKGIYLIKLIPNEGKINVIRIVRD